MIGRSVRGPKPVILRGDDAVDWENSAWGKYLESGFDAQHLKMIPGRSPTTFTIGQLSHPQRIALDGIPVGAAHAEFLIRCCLLSVSGYVIIRPDGARSTLDGEPTREMNGALGSLVTSKWMEDFTPLNDHLVGLAVVIRVNSEVSAPLFSPSGAGSGA